MFIFETGLSTSNQFNKTANRANAMQMITLTVYFENGGKPFSESVDVPMGAVPPGMDLRTYASNDPQFRRLLSVEPDAITAVRLTGRYDSRWPSIPLPL